MNLQTYIVNIVTFANGIVIPFLIGIAFLMFVVNVIRYFVIGATNDDSREKARALALYSVLAFVFILVFWGITNMLAGTFGMAKDSDCYIRTSDYVINQQGSPRAGVSPCPEYNSPTAPGVGSTPTLPGRNTSPSPPRTTPSRPGG